MTSSEMSTTQIITALTLPATLDGQHDLVVGGTGFVELQQFEGVLAGDEGCSHDADSGTSIDRQARARLSP